MSGVARLAACLALLLLPAAARAAQLDLLDHLSFTADGRQLAPGSRYPNVPIDATVAIAWDEDSFLRDLAAHIGAVAPGEPLQQRIEILETGVERFLATQRLLLETKAVAREWIAAGQPTDGELFQRFRATNDRFGRADQLALEGLRPLASAADRAVLERVEDAFLGGQADDFTRVASVLEEELGRLTDELGERVARGRRVEVEMWAAIYGASGDSRPLHLEGYDDRSNGPPVPTPRFSFSVDDRTRRELHAAEQLGELVTKWREGELEAQLEDAARVARDEARELLATLEAEALRANLDALEAAIRADASDASRPLLAAVRNLRALLDDLASVGAIAADSGGAQSLARLADAFEFAVRALIEEVARLDATLRALRDAIAADANAALATAKANAVAALEESLDALAASDAIAPVTETWRDVVKAFGLERSVIGAAEAVGRIPRRVTQGTSLDTRLVLLGAGEQHAGDTVVVSARVRAANAAGELREITSAHRGMTLRWFGLHSHARGALLFADPRSRGFDGQSWEIAPAIGYVVHYGIDDDGEFARLWNDWLDPGLGVSLALLDFEDGADLEIGAAATLTLFGDVLWTGFGRNLQAESNYFFVGVNPLALGDLYRQAGNAPAPGAR